MFINIHIDKEAKIVAVSEPINLKELFSAINSMDGDNIDKYSIVSLEYLEDIEIADESLYDQNTTNDTGKPEFSNKNMT